MAVFVIVLLIISALYLFLIFPSPNSRNTLFDEHKLFAHRGYFGGDVPENSMAAFSNAAEHGYGIELDVHTTLDGVLVVHHDDKLDRLCGSDRYIERSVYSDICDMRLPNGEKLPLLEDVLNLVGGRVPLVIELKCTDTDTKVAERSAKMLDGYGGEYCIESFDPFVIKWWRLNRPEIMRGQLAGRTYFADDSIKTRIIKFIAENLLLNFISRPDFISYDIRHTGNLSLKICMMFGVKRAFWTIHTPSELKKSENLGGVSIFQDFEI